MPISNVDMLHKTTVSDISKTPDFLSNISSSKTHGSVNA